MRRIIGTLVVLGLGMALVTAHSAYGTTGHKVRGTVLVVLNDALIRRVYPHGGRCDSIDDNAKYGARVNILDGNGKAISHATIGLGHILHHPPANGCALSFTASVPNARAYGFKVAGLDPVVYTRKDLASANWKPFIIVDPTTETVQ
jgi:hypothetical protein